MSFVRCRGKTRLTINPVFRTGWSRAVTAQSSLRLNTLRLSLTPTSMSVVQSVFTSCTQSVKGQGQGITWPPLPPPQHIASTLISDEELLKHRGQRKKKTIPTHAQHTCDKLRLLWPSSTVQRQTQSGVRCWLKSDRCSVWCDKQNTRHTHFSGRIKGTERFIC